MTNAKIDSVLSDPDAVAFIGQAICGFTSCELIVLRSRMTRERRAWAHAQRQLEPKKRVPFIGWRLPRK